MSEQTDRPADEAGARRRAARDARRVVMPGAIGPVLVQGPVEVVLDDGTTRLSERPVVALCACGRSASYPFCDTSHRRRSRPRERPGPIPSPDPRPRSDAGASAAVRGVVEG